MPNFLRFPKVQLSATLFLIYLTTTKQYPVEQSLFLLLICLISTIFSDLLFIWLRKEELFLPWAAVVTALIIALIINPDARWYQIIITCAIAMGIKNFLRFSGRHIFNPAASGLLVTGLLFDQDVNWWGVSFQNITSAFSLQTMLAFCVLVLPLFISGYRMRRYKTILTFIVTYAIFSQIFTSAFSLNSVIGRILDPTVIFFSIVMLPEPMTSPANTKRQVFFGATVALITLIFSSPPMSKMLFSNGLLPDIFIPALLLGNIFFFKRNTP